MKCSFRSFFSEGNMERRVWVVRPKILNLRGDIKLLSDISDNAASTIRKGAVVQFERSREIHCRNEALAWRSALHIKGYVCVVAETISAENEYTYVNRIYSPQCSFEGTEKNVSKWKNVGKKHVFLLWGIVSRGPNLFKRLLWTYFLPNNVSDWWRRVHRG